MQFFKRSFPPHWPEASNKQTMDGSSLLIVGDKIYVFNISSVVEFRWWWVLESKIFTQESTCSKENLLKILLMNDNSSKSTKIVLWMLTFYVKKLFSSFNFGTPLFSKIMPNFWRTVIHQQNFFFPSSVLSLGQKSRFLGPTIFEIPSTKLILIRMVTFFLKRKSQYNIQ